MDHKSVRLAVILGAISLLFSAQGKVIPSPMNSVDTCIFTCDYCFQKLTLLECANECIDTNAQMIPYWTKACPELKLPMYVEVNDIRYNSVPDMQDNLINREN